MSSAANVACSRSASGSVVAMNGNIVAPSPSVALFWLLSVCERPNEWPNSCTATQFRSTERETVSNCAGSTRETKSVADLGIELNVVIKNRSRFVEAGGKLDVAIVVDVLRSGNGSRDIRIGITINELSINQC